MTAMMKMPATADNTPSPAFSPSPGSADDLTAGLVDVGLE
jgi:hypothetical protein